MTDSVCPPLSQLLHLSLKKSKVKSSDASVLEMLDPFVLLLLDCLESMHVKVPASYAHVGGLNPPPPLTLSFGRPFYLSLSFSSLPGDHRGSAGVHLHVEAPPAGSGAQRQPAGQAALRPAEGLLHGGSRPRGELPACPELLQGARDDEYSCMYTS